MASLYTTTDNVAGMFPSFQTGIPQQRPSSDLIQQFIDDIAEELNAILYRRGFVSFGQKTVPDDIDIAEQIAPGALQVLELLNRYGAAAQLGVVLASFGITQAKLLADAYEKTYIWRKNQLAGVDANGKPLPNGGMYDKFFDPNAATPSAEPALAYIAGGDEPRVEPVDEGLSNWNGKFLVM